MTTNGNCSATIDHTLAVSFPDDHVVTATATRFTVNGTPWSTSEFSNRGGEALICEDDDDHDNDGIRDDNDIDDDSDTDSEPAATDSDSDSERDSDNDSDSDSDSDRRDKDDDNDCIEDDFDSESKKEKQESVDDELDEGQEKTYDLVADGNTLLLTATASALSYVEPNYQPLTVEIYAPNGTLLASSPPIPGRAVVTAVPVLGGTYKVKIKNGAQAKVRYQSVNITREHWLR